MTLWMVSQLFGFATDNKTQGGQYTANDGYFALAAGLLSNGRASSATNEPF